MTCHGRLAPGPANRQFPGRMILPAPSGLRGAIRLYQLTLAYFFVGACRYEPSCSAYAAEAVARHGALQGQLAGGASPVPLRSVGRCAATIPVPHTATAFLPSRRARLEV